MLPRVSSGVPGQTKFKPIYLDDIGIEESKKLDEGKFYLMNQRSLISAISGQPIKNGLIGDGLVLTVQANDYLRDYFCSNVPTKREQKMFLKLFLDIIEDTKLNLDGLLLDEVADWSSTWQFLEGNLFFDSQKSFRN